MPATVDPRYLVQLTRNAADELDVTDSLDALGRQDLRLMDERIRLVWQRMRFWGPAVTLRALPANVRMPVLSPGGCGPVPGIIAKGILLDDVRKRRELYVRLGLPHDPSVDVEGIEAFYADV